jgi:hypothetical protein
MGALAAAQGARSRASVPGGFGGESKEGAGGAREALTLSSPRRRQQPGHTGGFQ